MGTLAYSSGATTLFSLAYNYGAGNNGQIQSVSDNMDGTRTTTYTYDAWARLKMASNTQWTVTETYDRYGNRKSQSAPVFNSVTVDPNTNRFLDPGYAYDAAGNMTADGLNALAYDAENRLVSSTQAGATSTYTYDGNSLRVKKISGGATTVYLFSGTEVIAEYAAGAAPASPTREYIYSGSQLLATIEGISTKYHHRDHLSVRMTTDATGSLLGQQGHYPFGEDWYNTSTTTKWKFTSYERDTESGNDYAMARYHINRLGRFSSPDPLGGSIVNPQSLNRYAYVRNIPVSLVDPLGLDGYCDASGCHVTVIDFNPSGGSGVGSGDMLFIEIREDKGGPSGQGSGVAPTKPGRAQTFADQLEMCLHAELKANAKAFGKDIVKIAKLSVIVGVGVTVVLTVAQPEIAPVAPVLAADLTLNTFLSFGASRLTVLGLQNGASTIGCTAFTARNVFGGK